MAAGRLSPCPPILNPNQSERADKSLSIDESNTGLADFPPLTESTSASQGNKEISLGFLLKSLILENGDLCLVATKGASWIHPPASWNF